VVGAVGVAVGGGGEEVEVGVGSAVGAGDGLAVGLGLNVGAGVVDGDGDAVEQAVSKMASTATTRGVIMMESSPLVGKCPSVSDQHLQLAMPRPTKCARSLTRYGSGFCA
jgi:hypothetical protein